MPPPNTTRQLAATRRFIFELNQLRLEDRSGWKHVDIEHPESVAEHTQRGSALGFCLAFLAKEREEAFAGVSPAYVSALITFHDMHEARTGDDDLIQKQYVTIDRHSAVCDQVKGLGELGDAIRGMWEEVEEAKTPSGILAKDAEILEMAFTAREYVVLGNTDAQAWIDAVGPRLQSNTAKELFHLLHEADPSEWWKEKLGYVIGVGRVEKVPRF